jgi:Putative lumazine-binding
VEFLLTILSFSTMGSFYKNCVFLLRRNSKSDRFHRLCPGPLLLICALTSTMATSAPVSALTPEEQAVLVPIQELFDGIAKRNGDAMKRVVLPEGGATIIRHNQVLHFTLKTFCERPFPPGALSLEEKIYDPLVRIDDNIAMVWARYEVLIDGKLDHWGTDIINLVFVDGKWMIAGVLDNSRRSDEPVKPLTLGN